jgi:hypothetical protein
LAWVWEDIFYQHSNHFSDVPNKLIPIKNYPEDIIKREYHKIEFCGIHNDVIYAPLIKKVFEEIKDIFKNSKIKLICFADTITSTSLALRANTLYFLPKLAYFYDKKPRKDPKRMTFEDKNLQMDEMTHLAFLRICLRFTESDNSLNAILNEFKERYEKNDFTEINKIFKEQLFICVELEERFKRVQFLEKNNNDTYRYKVNLVKDKCNLIRNAKVTLYINE